MGRPTKYDPAMPAKIIAWGKLGKSRTWIAAELGITRETLNQWSKQHEDISDALTRAKLFEQQWWEDAGQIGMVSDKFNNGVWAKSMSCRFSDEWRDKSDNTTTVQPGDGFADLLMKLGAQAVFPKDE